MKKWWIIGIIVLILILVAVSAYVVRTSNTRICLSEWEYWVYFPDTNECKLQVEHSCDPPQSYLHEHKSLEECETKNGLNSECYSNEDCSLNEICYNSQICSMTPEGVVSCGQQFGDLKCHKECEIDNDCPQEMPNCAEVTMWVGDAGELAKICLSGDSEIL